MVWTPRDGDQDFGGSLGPAIRRAASPAPVTSSASQKSWPQQGTPIVGSQSPAIPDNNNVAAGTGSSGTGLPGQISEEEFWKKFNNGGYEVCDYD